MSPRSLSPGTKPTFGLTFLQQSRGNCPALPSQPTEHRVLSPTLTRSEPSAAGHGPRTPHRLLPPLHFIPTRRLLRSWGCACGLQLSVNSALLAHFPWKFSLKKELF